MTNSNPQKTVSFGPMVNNLSIFEVENQEA
jgi:hypothetical protein